MTTQVASDLELMVMEWLDRKGIGYSFQTSFAGGYYALGGAVVDFLLEPNLAWRVQGEFWHRGVLKSGSDTIQREMLTALGYVVVDLWAEDIKERIDETLNLALRGEEMLK